MNRTVLVLLGFLLLFMGLNDAVTKEAISDSGYIIGGGHAAFIGYLEIFAAFLIFRWDWKNRKK